MQNDACVILSYYWIIITEGAVFYVVLIVALNVDKSSTAYSRKDFVLCEHLFWRKLKETRHLFVQYQFHHCVNTKHFNYPPKIYTVYILLLPTIDTKKENSKSIRLVNNKLSLLVCCHKVFRVKVL